MSNQSIIEHKANMFYVEFREDYLAICLTCTYKKPVKGKEKSKASPHCKALILAIAEGWTNDKRGKGTDLSFYMTYPQWVDAMYGMFGRNVVIDSVDELIGEKLLSRESMRLHGKDTYRYLFNYQAINQRMKTLADRTPYTTRPQVNALINKRDELSTGLQVNGMGFTSKRDTGLLVNGNASKSKRNIESTNHPYTESTQHQNDANASTPARVSHPEHHFIWFDDLMAPTVMTVRLTPSFPHPHYCEIEDKRRERIAGWEVEPFLKSRGLNVTVRIEHETGDETTIETSPAREEPYVPVFDLPQRQAIQELSPVLDEKIEQVDEERIRIASQPSDLAQGLGYEKPVRAVTSQAASLQPRAKAEPKPLNRAARIDLAFQWLDKVRKEASGDPMASYVANGANKKRLGDLIDACANTPNEVNEANVSLAWLAMWNAGQWTNGKSWQDPGMLTIKAFCEHYGASLERARAKSAKKATPKPVSSLPSYSHMSDAEYYASLRGGTR